MKKHLLLGGALLMAVAACAQSGSIKITGKPGTPDADQLELTNLDGVSVPVKMTTGGGYEIALNKAEKGFYQLGAVGEIYLEPGFDLVISPDAAKEYTFTGKGAVENNLMRQVRKMVREFLPFTGPGGSYAMYQVDLPVFKQKIGDYKVAAARRLEQSQSAFFKKMHLQEIHCYTRVIADDYDLFYGTDSAKQAAFFAIMEKAKDLKALNFDSLRGTMFTRKMSKAEEADIRRFSKEGIPANDEMLFRSSPSYRTLVNHMITMAGYSSKKFPLTDYSQTAQNLQKMNIVNDTIGNALIREYLLYKAVTGIVKAGQQEKVIDSVYNIFMAQAKNPVYKATLKETYDNNKLFADKAMAPLFDFESISGKKVSLASLRGKYVYIDVWATWCGPCKREIPFLSEVEKKYHGKNIQFVSLSVDTQKDKTKWQQYVNEHQLKGIQVIADQDFRSDFVKKFNINSIPRFILIGPDGRIVSKDAERPSDPALQQRLDGLL